MPSVCLYEWYVMVWSPEAGGCGWQAGCTTTLHRRSSLFRTIVFIDSLPLLMILVFRFCSSSSFLGRSLTF